MEHYHKLAQDLNNRQQSMYFKLGALVQNRLTTRYGRGRAEANHSYETAFIALDATGWKSLKAAKAMLTVTRAW